VKRRAYDEKSNALAKFWIGFHGPKEKLLSE
jgi:hypothetical protein